MKTEYSQPLVAALEVITGDLVFCVALCRIIIILIISVNVINVVKTLSARFLCCEALSDEALSTLHEMRIPQTN